MIFQMFLIKINKNLMLQMLSSCQKIKRRFYAKTKIINEKKYYKQIILTIVIRMKNVNIYFDKHDVENLIDN